MSRKIASDYELNVIENPTKAYLAICFGMLSYRVLFEHDDEQVARRELAYILAKPERMKEAAKGYTRDPQPGDFDVRTPEDMEALTRAILDTYR
jgi:hypothetical protein